MEAQRFLFPEEGHLSLITTPRAHLHTSFQGPRLSEYLVLHGDRGKHRRNARLTDTRHRGTAGGRGCGEVMGSHRDRTGQRDRYWSTTTQTKTETLRFRNGERVTETEAERLRCREHEQILRRGTEAVLSTCHTVLEVQGT